MMSWWNNFRVIKGNDFGADGVLNFNQDGMERISLGNGDGYTETQLGRVSPSIGHAVAILEDLRH